MPDSVETIEEAILATMREEYADMPHALALLDEHHTQQTVHEILMSKIGEQVGERVRAELARSVAEGVGYDKAVARSQAVGRAALAETDMREFMAEVIAEVMDKAQLPRRRDDG